MAVLPGSLGGGAGALQHIGRQAIYLLGAGAVAPGIGGVQGVFAEFLAQFGQAFLDSGKALFGRALQLGAREHKVAQRVGVCLALLVAQAGRGDGLVLGVQALVSAQARPELGDARQRGVVGGAQLRRVHDAVEVVHRTPGAPQVFGGDV